MITESDRKAAEEHATLWYYSADGQKKSGGMNPTKYESFLAGIEHERKQLRVYNVNLDNVRGLPDTSNLTPIEQVGDKKP
jgi:hypothetical protein